MSNTASVQPAAPTIYRVAAVAVIAMFVVVIAQITVFAVFPPPTTADGWLSVYIDSPVRGFLNADGLYLLTNVLSFTVYVALWVRLRTAAPALAGTGLAVAALSLAVYLPTNVSVDLGIVAARAAGASGEAHTAALGAVEALLARSMGTAFVVYYLLGAVALILFGRALRSTGTWGRTPANLALASGVLMLVPSTFGMPGLVASFASLVPYLWFCGIAVGRLRRDALTADREDSQPARR